MPSQLMRTLFDPDTRSSVHDRIDRLKPESERRWGKMHAPQMVCHVADQLRVALGDIETESSPGVLRFKPLRQVMVFWMPWPKGRIETAPEMLTTAPSDWRHDIAELHGLIDKCGARDPDDEWSTHPLFGPLSGQEWGALSYKHLDYHLQQFGV